MSREEKLALARRLLQQKASRAREYPLSFGQQRLWFLDQLAPGNIASNLPGLLRLRGALNVEALRAALREIVQRHEALRTTFPAVNGAPIQRVAAALELEIPLEDLAALPPRARDERIAAIARDEGQRPFDLVAGPLLRARLIRAAADEHLLLLAMHHIVVDGWSLAVLVRELAALYEALAAGRPSPLEPLSLQYGDFSKWQRERVQGEHLESLLSYWRQVLASATTVLELPADRPRPPVQSFRGARRPVVIPRALAERLSALARREGATLFMVLLAGLDVLLSRYSGEGDIVVGVPVASRTRAELEGLIGFFVNSVAIRAKLGDDPGFTEFLRRVRGASLDAFAHQELPFERLVEALRPQRDQSHAPIFQVEFVLQNTPPPVFEAGGLKVAIEEVELEVARVDLTVALTETAEGITGSFDYNADLFDPATIDRMISHYRVLLESIVDSPERRVSELRLLTSAERRRATIEWNATEVAHDGPELAHRAFEERARSCPEADAVLFEGQRLTYAELDSRANGLAHRLRAVGVGRGAKVAVCAERSPELVIGVLAILKAGGAYLPVDPAYPSERISYILGDARPSAVLASRAVLGGLPTMPGAVVLLDDEANATPPATPPQVELEPADLAYVIYTSGSTGQPKGVALHHGGLCNLARAQIAAFDIREKDRVLQFAAFSFDASVSEIFTAVLAGAALVLARRDDLLPVDPLTQVLRDQAITHVTLPPSALAALSPEGLPALRTVISAGEACPPALAARWQVNRRFLNAYGPTEITVCATVEHVEGAPSGAVPIGRPIGNMRVYVLDGRGEPVPVGAEGRICVGGRGVARGYLGQASLTAERFIPDPFGPPGSRLYDTGDRGRYLPDGRVVFAGRSDDQLKVRGFRIEPGEIEAALARHPAVREAAVVGRADGGGSASLVAFFVANAQVTSAELRPFLGQSLPEYMVPSAFVALDALPKSPTGKVDRGVLRVMEFDAAVTGDGYVEPRTATEEIVAGVWASTLGHSRVGIRHDFFELGGHSLLATQVTSRLRQAFSVDVPVRAIFEHLTVERLARHIEALRTEGLLEDAPPIVPVIRDGTAPLSFGQRRLWLADQLVAERAAYNLPAVVRLSGVLDAEALRGAIASIVDRHEVLRTSYSPGADGTPVQVIAPSVRIELPRIALASVPASDRDAATERYALEEAARPFDLSRAPLLRASLLEFAEDEHVLLLTMHHITSDGWSVSVLLRELAASYGALARGERLALPTLPIQYADYAAWQQAWMKGEVLERGLAYWRRKLAGAPTLQLPTDRPRPAVQSFRGASHSFTLPGGLADALETLSRREGATLFMTLLAGFDALLARYTGQSDLMVGTTIANRNRLELESLIGFFVNTLVLRTDVAGRPTTRELVRRVREVTLEAYAHQDVPFEQLVTELEPGRDVSRSPLFQVMFSFQNMPQEPLALPGVTMTPLDVEGKTSKFDLTLTLERNAAGLVGSFEYATDLFDRETIVRMASHLGALLRGMAEAPDRPVASLPILLDEERTMLLERWAPERVVPVSQGLHERFEEAARAHAGSVAVVCGEERLTYAELDRRANQLARTLRKRGVGAGKLVAICLERTNDLVVAILGVLKAGGAYVPLDTAYPRDRLEWIVEDAQCPVLVTQTSLLDRVPGNSASVLCLDSSRAELEREEGTPPAGVNRPEDTAYVIYTSGSTGKPKGCLVTHANAMRLFDATDPWFHFGPEDTWTLFHSAAFDFSVWEIWGALLYGGRLVVVPFEVSRSPDEFRELVRRERVTVLNQTPSAFRQFIHATRGEAKLEALRCVIFGGEALEPATLRPWVEQYGAERPALINMYGITETTVHVTYRKLTVEDLSGASGSIIGAPIPDLRVYVLDAEGELAPIGVTGELYVAGAGVSDGYLNRGPLTALRFIPDPFSRRPGARLYRTGDLGRYRHDGALEYLGRIDEQVKIRGFRIELGEIEAALLKHSAVRESVVMARPDPRGDKQLVGYIVVAGEAPEAAELRAFLCQTLPEYMVPAAFVPLEALPLTTNGKVDRRALPEPTATRAGSGVPYAPPRTDAEQAIARAWAEALGLERVGIDDNFFEIGGDSIRAIRALSGAAALGVKRSMRSLFQHPTVRGLAQAGAEAAGETPAYRPFSLLTESERALVPEGIVDAYPLTLLQQGMAFHNELEREAGKYHDILSLRLRVPFNEPVLRSAIAAAVERHAVLRTSFEFARWGRPLQLVHERVTPPVEIVDLRGRPQPEQEQEVEAYLARERGAGFNWSVPPLFRVTVHRLAEDALQLSIVASHAILDGWSFASLLSELLGGYMAIDGAQGTSEALRSSFAEFVALERAALDSQEARSFWARLLEEAPSVAPRRAQGMPSSPPEPVDVPISPEMLEGLRATAHAAGVPLKSVLLAAHVRVVALLAGTDDIVTGVVASGRPEGEHGERSLGLFLNTLPFRVSASSSRWIELARRVFEREREALPSRRFPLAEAQRMHGGRQLFDTTFNFVHFHVLDPVEKMGGLEVLGSRAFTSTELGLAVDFELTSRGLLLQVSCDDGTVTEARLRAIGGYYARALEAIARTPESSPRNASLLSSEELRALTRRTGTARREARWTSVHALFEARAREMPDAVALESGARRVTYGELNRQANRLARAIRARAAGPDVRVAICLPRSPELIGAMLAILKAGAAYVPLDPADPGERLALMIGESGAALVVTQAGAGAALPPSAPRLDFELDELSAGEADARDLELDIHPEQLAYLIFTSGSTGRPKGVCIPHGALANCTRGAIDEFTLTPRDRALQFASSTFDASVEEIFPTLAAGATLVLRSEAMLDAADVFFSACADARLTVLNLPTAFWHSLAADIERGGVTVPRTLRLLVMGGERALARPLRVWTSAAPWIQILNTYGPTETTVTATGGQVTASDDDEVPIGLPVRNAAAYVLDENLIPVPAGTPGELCLGGPGVARGYLDQPVATATAFVPDPFSSEPGARLYRTGDLVRWREDGTLAFLGRRDHQVKVRGFRVELGEVENALRAHPGVREAVAVVRDAGTPGARLVAYVVEAQGAAAEAVALRSWLRGRLPGHMVPSSIRVMEEFPLTPSGKIDRRALPAPDEEGEGRIYVEPRTETEKTLAAIWSEVLGLERVGVSDHFFELGGHSLLATQAVARARRTFQAELPLKDLLEAPTLEAFARRVEARVAEKAPEAPSLVRTSREAQAPLSFGQERLWFLDQLERGSYAYNVPSVVRVVGPIEVRFLEEAFTQIVHRHEALRTNIREADGVPVQLIMPPARHVIATRDLRAVPEGERPERTKAAVIDEIQRPFDLATDPPIRTLLLRVGAEEHVLVVTMHHIASDGWSVAVLLRELGEVYAALVAGRPPRLPDLPVQFADYAAWQRRWLSGERLEAQLAYWERQLASPLPVLALPTDRPRPAVQTTRGAIRPFRVPAEASAALKELGRRLGATLFHTLLAAFDAFLHRYSGTADVVVGVPTANRGRVELEGLIGFFVNTLALRVDLADDPPFVELLDRVRRIARDAEANQDVPFERLVERLRPERDLSRTPIFQVMFAFQNTPAASLDAAALRFEPFDADLGAAKFDLTLFAAEAEGGFEAAFEYNTDLFDAGTIDRLAQHFLTMLGAIAANPRARVSSLPLLAPRERTELLDAWGRTQLDWGRVRPEWGEGATFLDAFEARVSRAPDALAVICAERRMTYAELDRQANRLAHALRAAGVGENRIAAVLLDRGIEFLVTMIAVFKAGGAYVPLDPVAPETRLAQMLGVVRPPVILADAGHQALAERLAGLVAAGVLDVNEAVRGQWPDSAPPSTVTPRSLAYVIFTSGSTGTPKGAMIEHRGMLNHLLAKVGSMQVTERDVVAETATQTFDVSVWQFLCALLAGGVTSVFEGDTAWEPVALLQRLRRDRVTIFETVPSHMRLILDELESAPAATYDVSSLRWMMLNGEGLPPELCTRWFRLEPGVPIINAYGPTECSDDVTQFSLHAPPPEGAWAYVPISGTLPNLRIYLLDGHLEPVPAGVTAELYIGGTGVGRGYLADPARTATAFLPDLFASEPGARMYRTGDLARYRPDGTIEFLGRADHQIKIRGVRIELGEVEAALAKDPAVRDVVVVAARGRRGEAYLAAYVVPRDPAAASAERRSETARAVLDHARTTLSAAMVPSAVVVLESMPLLPNGKIDRRSLPEPGEPLDVEGQEGEAPRGPIESLVAQVWAELIGIERMGRRANFFELGGHSLAAIRTVSRVRKELGVEVTVRAVFEHPTVEDFARYIASKQGPSKGADFSALLAREPKRDVYDLAVYQLPEWYMHELEPGNPFYNICIDTVLRGRLDLELFARAWRMVIDRHAALRTFFRRVDGQPMQVVRESLQLTLDEIYLDRRAVAEAGVPDEMASIVRRFSNTVFDFESGPLFRLGVAEFTGNQFLVVFVVHHIVWDETSTINLTRELQIIYNALLAGKQPQLDPIELDYVDFAASVNRAVRAGSFEPQRRYWLETLTPLPPALDLPTDRPRPHLQTFRGSTVGVELSPALSGQIEEYLRANQLTLYIYLLAVLNLQLYRLSGQADFVVGTPIANRDDPRLEHLFGLFATALPMRCTINREDTFESLLQRTRRIAVEAYDNHNYPSVLAIQELNPEHDLSRNRLFSVMYGVQNDKRRMVAGLAFDGLEIVASEGRANAEDETSKFDLTFVVEQVAEGISVRLNFNTDLFDAATGERMLRQFVALTEETLRDPRKRLEGYRMQSAADEARVLNEFNASGTPFDRQACIHQRIAAQAQRTPDAVALTFGGDALTYRELDEASNRLARFLLSRGVGPEVRVAILLDPSPHMIVAMLAVLKAGGAYIPVSTEHPRERQLEILERAGCRVALARGMDAPSLAGAEVVDLDARWPEIADRFAPTDPGGAVSPEALAYVMFTSGTTGVPKGISVAHAGIVNLIESTQRSYELGPRDAILFLTPFNFDASLLEIFWPLATGARVVIPTDCNARSNPALIGRLVGEEHVTTLQCVPIMLAALVDGIRDGSVKPLASLRRVICGGSFLTRELRDAFAGTVGVRLANHYGPTEVTVDATSFDCEAPVATDIVPIGRPISNTRIYVLDTRMAPVPIGITGEIYVASPGLARGYLDDPASTATRFVPDPFSREPGGRLYRTGDLGRFGADGVVHFVGRVDKQVKVRGNRVELEEIEARLARHPAVGHCVVRHRAESGVDMLVAHVELREAWSLAPGIPGLRVYTLAQRPELKPAMDALHVDAWPPYFEGDATMKKYWPRLASEFPQHQYALVDAADEVVAVGNAVPTFWDGTAGGLPAGWDAGLEQAFVDAERGRSPNALMILTGVADRGARGRGLSMAILKTFKVVARAHGLERVMVAVRPTGKADHPELSFEQWCALRGEDGQLADNWLRVHERVGGRFLKIDKTSQRIVAPLADWERWAGRRFEHSGEYQLKDTLQPVRIDVEGGVGEYYDPSIWVEHPHAASEPGWEHIDAAALRAYMREFVPDYMIPSHFRIHAALPLTDAGKIDERTLREHELVAEQRTHVPPQTPVQQRLASIWCAVLEIEQVGITDDFFELGGHSIRAVRMIAKISDEFGAVVALRDLFKHRTIRGLAAIIEANLGSQGHA